MGVRPSLIVHTPIPARVAQSAALGRSSSTTHGGSAGIGADGIAAAPLPRSLAPRLAADGQVGLTINRPTFVGGSRVEMAVGNDEDDGSYHSIIELRPERPRIIRGTACGGDDGNGGASYHGLSPGLSGLDLGLSGLDPGGAVRLIHSGASPAVRYGTSPGAVAAVTAVTSAVASGLGALVSGAAGLSLRSPGVGLAGSGLSDAEAAVEGEGARLGAGEMLVPIQTGAGLLAVIAAAGGPEL
ncbi:hypothetical protein T492DRAFT_1100239 [Pavlovales sp. CCMP2436]|nr:hypothetical protein T492DRAFT_1100239 [Pavlovales sp. CCMP2436]|mmetsp:Transcript_21426/g.49970  ORF Transcript_21426/g.49970 Transcript_21426/m.49970 type:complete len:242 (-) Transcript_21426:509-1234(-)